MLNNARKKANYYVSRDPERMTKMDLYDFYIIGDVYREEFRKERRVNCIIKNILCKIL